MHRRPNVLDALQERGLIKEPMVQRNIKASPILSHQSRKSRAHRHGCSSNSKVNLVYDEIVLSLN
jgi:hypothetical protein